MKCYYHRTKGAISILNKYIYIGEGKNKMIQGVPVCEKCYLKIKGDKKIREKEGYWDSNFYF